MIVDPNLFFKNLTLSICSSLDLHQALKRCLAYLAEIFPVEELSMNIFDSQHGAVRIISRATVDGSKADSEVVTLPDDFCEWLSHQSPTGPVVMTSENMKKVPSKFLQFFNHKQEPEVAMVVPLVLEKDKIGVLFIYAPPGKRYNQEHLNLMASVMEPFAIAMSNAITYQQLVRLRDTLIDDKAFLQRELVPAEELIGEHQGLKKTMRLVNQVAPLQNSVLIFGETGVGKEVIANAIHQRSSRRHGPFIKVNCGAIDGSLMDSELFGYEKGAFTGATSQRRGRFERANGGTIFLDEVGELSPEAQVRLLRVLSAREIERLGGEKVIPVDIRVITATHRDLAKMVDEGRFREDLWFRLNVFPIYIPPLRERKEDIEALFHYFVGLKSRELGISPPTLAPDCLTRIMEYPWPGNVRELENVVERELIRAPHSELKFEVLDPKPVFTASVADSPVAVLSAKGDRWLSLDEVMKGHIQRALKLTKGRISGPGGAAELLKINSNTLRSRMDKFNINYK